MPDPLRRHPGNPVPTAGDFRNTGGRHGTNLGIAWTHDGADRSVEDREITLPMPEGVRRDFDPRLTVLEGEKRRDRGPDRAGTHPVNPVDPVDNDSSLRFRAAA